MYMNKFQRIVDKEMQRWGFDVTVIRVVKGIYNPATSQATNTEIQIPCRAMIFDLTLQSNGTAYKSGTLIEAGDKQLLIQPNFSDGYFQHEEVERLEPNKDFVLIGNKKYKIITFKEINPSNSDSIIWDCYVRL